MVVYSWALHLAALIPYYYECVLNPSVFPRKKRESTSPRLRGGAYSYNHLGLMAPPNQLPPKQGCSFFVELEGAIYSSTPLSPRLL